MNIKLTRYYLAAAGVASALLAASPVTANDGDRDRHHNPEPRRVDRGQVEDKRGEREDLTRSELARLGNKIRTIDGTGNNRQNPEWGAALVEFLRLTTVGYADGVEEPAGAGRPSAREISNAVASQEVSVLNRRGASDFLWQWGQFLDHDIDETPTVDPSEFFDIEVPAGDPWFDPNAEGDKVISLNRSLYDDSSGVRQQINAITAFIDGSMVYGSEEDRAHALRAFDGTGRLKTSAGDLLPYNTEALPNAPTAFAPNFFLAGDVRANEQVGLTAMHTLFMREHNYWALKFAQEDPTLSDEELYQMARTMVIAEIQAITYREFLPVLLGPDAIPRYRGYKQKVNPGIANVFATAAYRVGHTMLSPQLLRVDEDGGEIDAGHLDLADAFFNPAHIEDEGIDSILRGLAAQRCQEVDNMVVDAVRNFLFGPPGAGGFDLASLNIQRGRDHGLPGYNQVREDYGLKRARRFRDINRDDAVQERLESVYNSPDEVDPWVGLLAESHERGAMVGPAIHRILRDQFIRLRDGDRFWYERIMSRSMVRMVERQTLAEIIRRNTGIGDELQNNVFLAR